MADLNYTKEIPETGETLEENALQKAQTIYNEFSIPCFSDDSGLFIHALAESPEYTLPIIAAAEITA